MKSSTPLNELRFYGVSTLEDTAYGASLW